MESFEKKRGVVTFLNQPERLKHAADTERSEERQVIAEAIPAFIAGHEHLRNQHVRVSFAERGVSSLVALLQTPTEKLVLKTSLISSKGEGEFLRAWEQVGVKVPHVFEVGTLADHDYLLMEHIDARTLEESYSSKERLTNGSYVEMGKTLRMMHEAKGEGYGIVEDGKAKFTAFSDWLCSPKRREAALYLRERGYFDDSVHGSLEEAERTLIEYVEGDSRSVYCHFDFGSHNVFATKPLTVFDPNPMLNHPYIDLGHSMVLAAADEGQEAARQFAKGYDNGAALPEEVVRASVLINSYTKFKRWDKVGRVKNIQKVQAYLAEKKAF